MSESQTRPQESTEHTGVDRDVWKGPFSERTRYGEPTGEHYYRCRDCGRAAFEGSRSDLTHDSGCQHDN